MSDIVHEKTQKNEKITKNHKKNYINEVFFTKSQNARNVYGDAENWLEMVVKQPFVSC